jgi:phytoene dehydrogenase-like protein
MTQTDIVIIGSGIGGLACGALLAHYGFHVIVCESHNLLGGAAHSFEYNGFTFDSGPSLYSGLSSPSANPLRQVLDAVGIELPCVTYDTWGCWLPEGQFNTQVGANQFREILGQLRGEEAVAQWQELQRVMKPYGEAATAISPLALRWDWGALITMGRSAPAMLPYLGQLRKLTGPFSQLRDEVISDPFLSNWLDLLCFLLSGLPADGTSAAEMAFMFADWYRPGVVLDYPIGGSGALVEALVQGVERQGGQLWTKAHVEEVVVERGRAVGVRLRNGKTIRATKAVVANTSVWDTLKLLPPGAVPLKYRQEKQATPECHSFMHLHLGIDGEGIPSDLPCHHIYVKDWELGIDTPQNVVLVSIPSLIDPTVAPPGKHTIHVYTPGNEPYELWEGLDRHSETYHRLKEERSQVMWDALAQIIPDLRDRAEVTLVGTPLTHERFLRRHRGTYGPALQAGVDLFPGPQTPLPGLLCCGDSTFPGIGLPAVAASGAIAANTLASLAQHLELLKSLLTDA